MINKKWYMSKTIWGSGVAFLIAILNAVFGESSVYTQLLIAVASALGVYGRVNAKTTIKA